MAVRVCGALVALALVIGACGDDDGGEPSAEETTEQEGGSDEGGAGSESGKDGGDRESAEPSLGEPFTVESSADGGEILITANDASVTSGGGVQLLEVYVTAETPGDSSGRLEIFLACGANFFTGSYQEAASPAPRFPIDETTEGFGIDAGTTVEGWLDLTLPMTPDGEVVDGCSNGVQLVFSYGIFEDEAVIELPEDLAQQLTEA